MGSLHRQTIDTPLGDMIALASSSGLAALEFVNPGRLSRLDARLKRWYSPYTVLDEPAPADRRCEAMAGGVFWGQERR